MIKDAIKIESSGSVVRARIFGEIDNHTVVKMRGKIDEAIFFMRPRELEIDFSEVDFMDSSALALILGRAQTMRSLGGEVRLVGVTQRQLRLIRLCGIERIENLKISLGIKEEV